MRLTHSTLIEPRPNGGMYWFASRAVKIKGELELQSQANNNKLSVNHTSHSRICNIYNSQHYPIKVIFSFHPYFKCIAHRAFISQPASPVGSALTFLEVETSYSHAQLIHLLKYPLFNPLRYISSWTIETISNIIFYAHTPTSALFLIP